MQTVHRPDESSSDEVGLVVNHALAIKGSLDRPSASWIIDSGATSHICNNRKLFTQLFPLNSPVEVKLGNGHSLTAVAHGTVKLRVVYGRQNRSRMCSITEVLYVPELSYNLLSVPKVTKKVNFIDSMCYIQDKKQKIVSVGEKHDGLYRVRAAEAELNISETLSPNRLLLTKDVWHYRYGHLSMKNLQKLARDNLVDGFHYDPAQQIQFCDSCLEG